MKKRVSLVAPFYNESGNVHEFFRRVAALAATLPQYDFEVIAVNDGSRDTTWDELLQVRATHPWVSVIDLSRNFGKEAALSAGLEHAGGRAVVPIDVDLQDPPELILEMLAEWCAGAEVVLARRVDRRSDTMAKRLSSRLFYDVIRRLGDIPIPSDVGDFRLLDRKVVDALVRLPERTRFMKGIFAWLGFRQATVTYARPIRAAGTTKWKPLALWRLALEGIVSFSSVPLRLSSYIGIGCATVAFVYGFFIIARTIIHGVDLPGYASIVTLIMFTNGIILISLGIIGEYLARVFVEVKGRPLYLVREILD